MNHWPFVIAAYGITALGTLAMLGWTVIQLRRAEPPSDGRGE